MNPLTGILVYVIFWWLIFFMVLPIGVRGQHESAEGVTKGTEPGAPEKPMLLKKVIWTTAATTIVYALFYWWAADGLLKAMGIRN